MENQQSENQTPNMDMPTPEQIAAAKMQRAAMIAHYKEEMAGMKIEAAYNELSLRIEKARFDTWQYRIRFDQMMAPPPNHQQDLDKKEEGTDKLSPEANNLVKATTANLDNGEKGNTIPLTTTVNTEQTQN